MDPARLFSSDYREATAKFKAAAASCGLAVQSYVNPHLGPHGETLETLVCRFGPDDAENVLVLNSGVHGTEACVGSGLQTGILQDPTGFLARAPNTRVLMIHILNPYGAAWDRYVNEDNIDLMKNITYGDHPAPTDPIFEEFDDAIDLKSVADPAAHKATAEARKAFIDKYGMDRLMSVLKAGQTLRPESICYNGTSASWSKKTLDHILSEGLKGAKRVFFLDLHSGVGEFGEAYMVMGGDESSQALLKSWIGGDAHETDLVMTVPCYSTLAQFAPRGAEFAAATLEGGTATFDDGFRDAMWLEMYFHLYGDRTCERAVANKAVFKGYYYPISDEWRRTLWKNSEVMFARLLAGVESWRSAKVAA